MTWVAPKTMRTVNLFWLESSDGEEIHRWSASSSLLSLLPSGKATVVLLNPRWGDNWVTPK